MATNDIDNQVKKVKSGDREVEFHDVDQEIKRQQWNERRAGRTRGFTRGIPR